MKTKRRIYIKSSFFIVVLSSVLLQKASAQAITDMTKSEFDSIPYIEKPYRMIVRENGDFYQNHNWQGLTTGKGVLWICEIVEILKEYDGYFFVKTLNNGFGWVRKGCLKKPLNPNRRFCLEFTLGDSVGRGILANPVRVSSDGKGNFYVLEITSTWMYRLHKYDPEGNFVKFIPLPTKEIKNGYWDHRGTVFMKASKSGNIFILTVEGISKFSQEGEKVLEIKEKLNYPVALDISNKEDIYVLEYCKAGKWGNEMKDTKVKIFSREGRFIDSLEILDIQNPTDIKVKNEKIYVLGERIKPFEYIFSRYKSKREYKGEITDASLIDGFEEQLKNLSKSVVVVYSLDGKQIDEISVKNVIQNKENLIDFEDKYLMAWSAGDVFRIHWCNIAVDALGNIFAFTNVRWEDCSDTYIMKFDSLGNYKERLPYSRARCAYEGSPRVTIPWIRNQDIEVYMDDSILFIDNGWLYQIKKDSLIKAVKHTPKEENFINPTALAVDGENNIFVSDIKTSELKKYNPKGRFLWSVGGNGKEDGKFNYIGDMAVDRFGNVYIADNDNRRVQKFDKNGNFILSFRLPKVHSSVSGVVFDVWIDKDSVYVFEHRTQVFTLSGEFIVEKKSLLISKGTLWLPIRTFDKEGDIWSFEIQQSRKHIPIRIFIFDKLGEILDVYTAENFDKPPKMISDLAFDKDGNLWIVDAGSSQVKKYSIK